MQYKPVDYIETKLIEIVRITKILTGWSVTLIYKFIRT